MLKKIIQFLTFTFLLLNLTACGTVLSITESNYAVYAGVSKDFTWIREGGVLSVIGVIDLPLSFVLDSLMLPVTLSQ